MKTSDVTVDLHASAASDVGRVRATNEDTFICDAERGIFAVIDGMGGHAGGEVAAAIARRELELRLRRETGTLDDRIREAIAAANASILAEAARVPALTHMACVLTAAVVTPRHVVVGHVGDTRLYKMGPSGLHKLTHDHSPVGLLEDAGELSEEDAMHHPERNQVFREVGTSPRQPTDADFIEVITAPLAADEAILLCSDGLTDLVPARTIEALVREHAADPFRAASELVREANEAGGRDNVTAVIAARPLFADAMRSRARTGGAGPAGERHDGSTAAAMPARPTASPARSWPWALAAFVAVLGFLAVAWWATGGMVRMPSVGGLVTAPRILRVSPGAGEFASIGAALAASQPGDTIEVAPGTYAEQIALREAVAIRSRPRRSAILRRPPALAGPWTAVSATALRSGSISGFVIAGSADAPLDYGVSASGANVEIDDLEISGARLAAVRITGGSAVLLRSSDLHDNEGAAVVIDGSSMPEVLHNVIAGGPSGGGALVQVHGGARAMIAGNVIDSHGGPGVTGLSSGELAQLVKENVVRTRAPQPAGRGGRE